MEFFKQLSSMPELQRSAGQYGAVCLASLALCGATKHVLGRSRYSITDLKHETEALRHSGSLTDAFVRLQNYRDLDPDLFEQAVEHADKLLFLEKVLRENKVAPKQDDMHRGFSHFRLCVRRLQILQRRVRKKLGNSHAVVVTRLVSSIHDELQSHVIAVVRRCHKFDPDLLLKQAKQDIARTLREKRHAGRAGRVENSPSRVSR